MSFLGRFVAVRPDRGGPLAAIFVKVSGGADPSPDDKKKLAIKRKYNF